jgi:hypothetical protein
MRHELAVLDGLREYDIECCFIELSGRGKRAILPVRGAPHGSTPAVDLMSAPLFHHPMLFNFTTSTALVERVQPAFLA